MSDLMLVWVSRVKSLCQDLTGEHMFLLKKERLDEVLQATEVARLMSHLTVQKNLCGVSICQT